MLMALLLRATATLAVSAAQADAPASADGAGRIVASKEPGWPQWRGPRRDGICDEKGLLPFWPEGGPRLLWKADGLGGGFACPILAQDTIFIPGDAGDDLVIFALDLEGRPLWQAKNGRSWTKNYRGARACCAFDGGRLFHINAHGRAACLDPKTGRERWAVDILDRFDGKVLRWGLAECALADGPRLVVTPGGRRAAMAALDRDTGETVWASDPIEGDDAAYASPILFELGGRRHLVNHSSRHVFGVDADTGKALWKRPRPSRFGALCSTPLLWGDAVFVTSPDQYGGTLYRLSVRGPETLVEDLWTTPADTLHGQAVLVDGTFYASAHQGFKGWGAIDARTGKVRYETDSLAMGSVLWADGRLYCLSEQGEMALLKPGPDVFESCGRFQLVQERKKDVWTHPVILDGRLYLRYHQTLYCYDVRKR